MPTADVIVRRANPDDWQAARAIRLQALQETPLAFASTYEREVAFTEDTWRSRTQTSTQFLALDGDAVVGTASGYVDPGDPTTLHLVAMYVVPAARGRGLAAHLVDAVVDDGRRRELACVLLDVVETNDRARRVYEERGFVATGVTKPLPHAPELTEVQLRLPLL